MLLANGRPPPDDKHFSGDLSGRGISSHPISRQDRALGTSAHRHVDRNTTNHPAQIPHFKCWLAASAACVTVGSGVTYVTAGAASITRARSSRERHTPLTSYPAGDSPTHHHNCKLPTLDNSLAELTSHPPTSRSPASPVHKKPKGLHISLFDR